MAAAIAAVVLLVPFLCSPVVEVGVYIYNKHLAKKVAEENPIPNANNVPLNGRVITE